jgi:hypothetical protein
VQGSDSASINIVIIYINNEIDVMPFSFEGACLFATTKSVVVAFAENQAQ